MIDVTATNKCYHTPLTLPHIGKDYAFRDEYRSKFTEVTFSSGRDASTSFTINLREDMLLEGKETFSLSFSFKEATGDFNGAFIYGNSSTSPKCIIEDIVTDGIFMMCTLSIDIL